MGGSQNTKQLEALSKDPGKVISNSRFLGVVEIPLATTLHYNRGAVAPEPCGSCPWCLDNTILHCLWCSVHEACGSCQFGCKKAGGSL